MKNRLTKIVAIAAPLICANAQAENWIWVPDAANDGSGIVSNSVWSLNAYSPKSGELVIGVKDSYAVGNAFTNRRPGMQNPRAVAKLDLDEPVKTVGGDSYKITGFAYAALRGGAERDISDFVLPKTTTSIPQYLLYGYDEDSVADTTLTNIVANIPECTSIGNFAFARNDNFGNADLKTSFTLIAPNVKTIGTQAFNTGLVCVNLDEWNLSSVEEIGLMCFGWHQATGTFKLPKMLTMNSQSIVQAQKYTALELGTGWTLDDAKVLKINQKVIQNSRLKTLTFGPYAGINFVDGGEANAFTSSASITNIVFHGRPFEKAAIDAIVISHNAITAKTKDNQLRFTVFSGMEWDRVAREPTAEELAKRPDDIPDEELFGVYETQDGVGKAWIVRSPTERFNGKVKLYDARYAGGYIEILEGQNSFGYCYVGDTIKIRAVCEGETKFNGWENLPIDAVIDGNEAEFVLTQEIIDEGVCFINSPKWKFVESEGLLTNKFWKLNVSVYGPAPHYTLRLGDKNASSTPSTWSSGFTGFGEGVLDLSGEIEDDNGVKWTLTQLSPYAFAIHENSNFKTNHITKFVFPRETAGIGDGFFGTRNADEGGGVCLSMTKEIIMDIPSYNQWSLATECFIRQEFDKVVVKAPNMPRIGNHAFNCNVGPSDLSRFDLTGVKQIGSQGMAWWDKCYGTLKLSSVTNLGSMALVNMPMNELFLGDAYTPKDRQQLIINDNALKAFDVKMRALTSLVVGPYVKISVPGTSTSDDMTFQKLETIRFLGGVPEGGREFLDLALSSRGVPTDASKYAVIRASGMMGWSALASNLKPAEEAAAGELRKKLGKGEYLMGVYVNQAGNRIAWMVNEKSPHNPKSMIIIIR